VHLHVQVEIMTLARKLSIIYAMSLPFNVLVTISLLLGKRDLLSMTLVCKEWRDVIDGRKIHMIYEVRQALKQKGVVLKDAIIFQILKLRKYDIPSSVELLVEYWKTQKKEYTNWGEDLDKIIESQLSLGKARWLSRDNRGRPCIMIKPCKHFYQKDNPTLVLAMTLFEQACEFIMVSRTLSDVVVIVDFEGFSFRNFDMGFVTAFIFWARKYFKNLLGACYTIRSPPYAMICWRMVRVLIPQATVEKMLIFKKDEWRKPLLQNFPANCLPKEYGGMEDCNKLFNRFR